MKLVYLILIALFFYCCGNSNKNKSTSELFKKYCSMCHGEDGKLGINGSKDLTKSLLTKEERVLVIKNGRNTMTPFAGILSDNEILAIADYTFTLK